MSELIIKTVMTIGAYSASSPGSKLRASCTMSAEMAAQRLASKILGIHVADVVLTLTPDSKLPYGHQRWMAAARRGVPHAEHCE